MDSSKNSDAFEERLDFYQGQIYSHLENLNELLQKLDDEVVEYKYFLITETPDEHRNKKLTTERPMDNEWVKKIRDQMKLFHHYHNHSLKTLCEEYCSYSTCCKKCYQTCCN